MFAGRDGYNKNSKRAYSSYVELKCPFRFATCDWEAEVGVVPYATTYYETKGFGVTNVTLRARCCPSPTASHSPCSRS